LEARYPEFDGLNLCFETREGILKHCSRRNALRLEQLEPNGVGRRFIDGTQPSLEAQLCNLADAIAYNAHDIDDGVRSGLISIEQLQAVALFERHHRKALEQHPDLPKRARRLLYEVIRRMLSEQVYDVIDATRALIEQHRPDSADTVRHAPILVRFSAGMHDQTSELKQFLFAKLYRHPQVMQTTGQAQQMVRELFQAYFADPAAMPASYAEREDRARAVADYIAGMTDRFAAREHERLTGSRLL
jgi:dGTPase